MGTQKVLETEKGTVEFVVEENGDNTVLASYYVVDENGCDINNEGGQLTLEDVGLTEEGLLRMAVIQAISTQEEDEFFDNLFICPDEVEKRLSLSFTTYSGELSEEELTGSLSFDQDDYDDNYPDSIRGEINSGFISNDSLSGFWNEDEIYTDSEDSF